MTGILRAVQAAGSQRKLAADLKVSQQAVGQWVTRGYVPLDRALQIKELFIDGFELKDLVSPKIADLLGAGE